MEVKLSNAKVRIKDALTWGDSQKIQSALMSGAKLSGKASNAGDAGFDFDASAMLESKYVALECAVLEIEENGETKKFTREWIDNLTEEDGDKLYEKVDALSKKKK